jgi:hypothetical protein
MVALDLASVQKLLTDSRQAAAWKRRADDALAQYTHCSKTPPSPPGRYHLKPHNKEMARRHWEADRARYAATLASYRTAYDAIPA